MVSARHPAQNQGQAARKFVPGIASLSQSRMVDCQQQNQRLGQELADCQQIAAEALGFLDTLLVLTPLPIVIIGLETNQVLYKNAWAELFFDVSAEAAAGTSAPQCYANVAEDTQTIGKLRQGEQITNGAFQFKRLTGEVVTAQVSAQAIDYYGQAAALFVITDAVAQAADPSVAQPWQSFAALVEHSSDFIAMSSLAGEILYVNPAGRSLVGLESLAEACSKQIGEYLPESDVAHFCEITLPTLHSTGRHEGEGQLRHFSTNEQFDVHRSCFTIRHPQTNEVLCLATIQRDITAQKQAERALQEREAQFRAIASALPAPMVISRIADGMVLYANSQVEPTFGIASENLLGRKMQDFYANPADRPIFLEQFLRAQSLQHYELRLKRADGVPFWVAVSAQSIVFDGESALLSIFYDITSRKQAEMHLRAIAHQQAAVAELGQQALLGTDLDVLLDTATILVAQILEAPYCGVFERLPGSNALMLQAGIGWQPGLVKMALVGAQANSQVGYTLLTQKPIVVEDLRIETRFSGPPLLHNHRVISGISVVIPGHEQPFGVLGAYTQQPRAFTQDDIYFLQAITNVLATAIGRKQSEDRLHLLERAIAASSNGIVITDARQSDNPIIYVNRTFESMTGYRASEVMGRNCRFLQADDYQQAGLEILRLALQTDKECHVTLRNYRKDGTLFWNELHIAPVFDAVGHLTHFVGIQTDISDRVWAETALREQEEQYRRIVETATEGIWVLDKDSHTSFVNQQMALMLGYDEAEMIGRTLFSFMDMEGIAIANFYLERRQNGVQEAHDFKFLRKDGTALWAIISTTPFFDEDGQYAGVLGMLTDITARKQAEKSLRESEEQFRLIFDLAPIGIALNALDGRFVRVNQAFCEFLGYSAAELLDLNIAEISHPTDHTSDLNLTQKLIQGQLAHFQLEKRYLDKNGQSVNGILHATLVRDASGNPLHLISQVVDMTERKRLEEQLIHDAFHDALTGLHNRALFMDRLQQAIVRSKQDAAEAFAVLFLDLDRFKLVNDSLGHLVGDQLLVMISQRLQACLRNCDTIARFGGDEFAILLEPIRSVSDATTVADRIQQALSSPLNLNGYEIFTTTSIGIAFSATDYERPDDLLRDADTAMYRAKDQGKACYVLFDTAMYDQTITRLQLETDLRWAIERQELRVHYQPIVSLETDQITGFEALVRWQHSERGLISPAEFIPVAEETGLIIAIGEWVLHTACAQTCRWQQQFPTLPLNISVNLSSNQLSQPHLVQQIDQILQQTGLAPERLKLEITESGIMQNAASAAKLLAQLKALQIQLSIDDFGTGYSSLSRLHQFPIDTLKIDRSFVNLINETGDNTEMVQAIIAIAHSLGMNVIAEGVETTAQLAQLKQLHCEYGQGYFFARPLDRRSAEQLLLEASSG